MDRMYSPSPTVRSSPVPFYLRGMGQDTTTFDPTVDVAPILPVGPFDTSIPLAPDIGGAIPAAPGIFGISSADVQPLIDAGVDPNTADLVYAAAANNEISNAQFQQILSGRMSSTDISNMIWGSLGPQIPSGPFPSQAAQLAANEVAAAGGTAAQIAAAAAAVKPTSTAAQISSAVAAALKSTTRPTVGPSPRIATGLPGFPANLTAATIIPGIPNLAVVIGVGVLAVAAMGKR